MVLRLDKATGEKTFREIVGAMKKGSEHALEEFGKVVCICFSMATMVFSSSFLSRVPTLTVTIAVRHGFLI